MDIQTKEMSKIVHFLANSGFKQTRNLVSYSMVVVYLRVTLNRKRTSLPDPRFRKLRQSFQKFLVPTWLHLPLSLTFNTCFPIWSMSCPTYSSRAQRKRTRYRASSSADEWTRGRQQQSCLGKLGNIAEASKREKASILRRELHIRPILLDLLLQNSKHEYRKDITQHGKKEFLI